MTDALIDIGANLTSKVFRADLPAVLARAAAAGVRTAVVTGTSVEVSHAAAALGARHAGDAELFSTAGVHPHQAKDVVGVGAGAGAGAAGRWLDELRALAQRPRVVAVGECGLDFNRNYSPERDQLACFEAQIALAAETRLPLFLHERDAHQPFAAMLKRHRASFTRAVVHCFTGGRAELEAYLALDLHIGITGWICDERRGVHLRELVATIPAGRLMIETDAPYLLPRDMPAPPKDRRNEPAFLPYVLRAVARARGEDPAETARITTETTRAFFALPTPSPLSSSQSSSPAG